MKSAEAKMCDIWKVSENQIEMTLSNNFQRLCIKPDRKLGVVGKRVASKADATLKTEFHVI